MFREDEKYVLFYADGVHSTPAIVYYINIKGYLIFSYG